MSKKSSTFARRMGKGAKISRKKIAKIRVKWTQKEAENSRKNNIKI